MRAYKQTFDSMMGVKTEPNEHEVTLIQRGQKYISKLAKIPGVKMIAIVNSLSMYATHPDSDIDLFIVTRPGMIWFVRFWATIVLYLNGVWRRDRDIAGNLCLSFFITTESMDLSQIAIENDIYLYYWIYYMMPIYTQWDIYGQFLEANSWVELDDEQGTKNQKYIIHLVPFFVCEFFVSIREYFRKKFQTVGAKASFGNLKNRAENRYKNEAEKIKTFGTFSHKSTGEQEKLLVLLVTKVQKIINNLIRRFLLPKTLNTYEKLGQPEGVIISDQMLKFHNTDRRREIRDTILEKYFDK